MAVALPASAQLKYPTPTKGTQTDEYFGTKVADPYRALENTDGADTKKWVGAENKITFDYLKKIPFRAKLKKRMEELLNYPKYTVPMKVGKYYIFQKNNGLQNQFVVYIQEGLDGTPKVLLDPNKLSKDGTVSLGGIYPSKDDKYVAYSLQKAGSDWQEIYVIEVATGKKLKDHVERMKFSGADWMKDGFFYSKFDATGNELTSKNEFMKVYYHKLGTDQSKDQLVYEDKANPMRQFYASTTEDERYVQLYIREAGKKGNLLMVRDNNNLSKGFINVNTNFDVECSLVESMGETLYLQTNQSAPKNKIVKTTIANPTSWSQVIAESSDVLEGVSLVGGRFLATYMKDASHHVYSYDLNGKKLNEIALPSVGSVSGFTGKKDATEVFYVFTSFTSPASIYRYTIAGNTSTLYRRSEVKFNPDEYEAKQVFFKSKDGTKVPMFVVHKKGIKLDGTNPTYLYGYGGFGVSLTPGFSTIRMVLLENGAVFAMVNLRGGGEYGETWHEAGTKMKKQNVFDDFIAAGEYLIKEKYTSKEKLAIAGGSNGGLLVGAVMTQRPDLCKVALPSVGVMDMLRYHKFTIGASWSRDYGTSDDSKEMFNYLYKYSPLHNIKSGVNYPATFITTADHDDRVVPGHSFKFAATLQEKYSGKEPMLIRIESKAGHSAGKPTSKIIEEAADEYSFFFYNVGVTPKY